MHQLKSPEKPLKTKCANDGTKLTVKRELILSILLSSEKAMSAYEIVEQCDKGFGQALSPMSVYRILEFLESKQLVHKINIANKYVACSHINHDKPHFVSQFLFCSICQRVDEVPLPQSRSSALIKNAVSKGFEPLTTHIELNCICANCLANGTTNQ